jgi:hypothetical protein
VAIIVASAPPERSTILSILAGSFIGSRLL